jgi:hypothetical protein
MLKVRIDTFVVHVGFLSLGGLDVDAPRYTATEQS